jgi:hypothetical protein
MLISKPKAFRFDGAIFSGTISGTIVVVTVVVGTVVVGSVSAALSSLGPDEFRTERPVRHQARHGRATSPPPSTRLPAAIVNAICSQSSLHSSAVSARY